MSTTSYIIKKWCFFQSLPHSIKTLTLSSFIFALASFMVTPYLAIYLHNDIALNMELVGFIVALSTFIQFGGGIIANKLGLKNTMLLALIIRSFGFVFITFSAFGLSIIVIGVIFIALGSAFYMPSNKAYMIFDIEENMKPRLISISSAAFNAGMEIGPLLAAVLVNKDATLMFMGLGLLFFGLTLVHHFLLVSDTAAKPKSNKLSREMPQQSKKWLSLFLRAKRPLFFNFMSFYLYFYFQNFMGIYT